MRYMRASPNTPLSADRICRGIVGSGPHGTTSFLRP